MSRQGTEEDGTTIPFEMVHIGEVGGISLRGILSDFEIKVDNDEGRVVTDTLRDC
jgi:hypothetical protein